MASILGVVGNLAPKLFDLLHSEYKLQKNLRTKLKFVHQELQAIRPALDKVASVPWDQLDDQVKVWAHQVREASHDMEDILDTFLLRVDGAEPVSRNRLKRATKKVGVLIDQFMARRDISGAIDDIQKQLEVVAQRRDKYRIDGMVAKPATIVDPRLSAVYKKASQLVGIDKPRDELIKMLSIAEDDGSNSEMKIVSIVGFGGLGKTTLAKAVYDKVSHQFDCGAFVPVGHNPDPTKVLRDILIDLINDADRRKNNCDPHKMASLAEKSYSGGVLMSLDQLQLINLLSTFLEGKSFFIVVDDIWETPTWELLENVFDDRDSRSRIIATTRIDDVSEKIGKVYRMKKLPESESKKLLYTRIFETEEQWPENNDEVAMASQKILGRCDGVPLAIITIGSCLSGKPIQEWSNVYDSIGFGHADDREVNNMKKILSFSYYDLPCPLRTCLLYLAVFPEDYTIDRCELIWMWIAEGLVQTEEGKELFETGESYFLELINRGMIQPVGQHGILRGCRVHDMVLRMIGSLSRDENFLFVQDSNKQWSQGSDVRRLAQHRAERIQDNDTGMQKLRSFNAMFCCTENIHPVSRFKLLRVLSLVGCRPVEGHLDTEFLGKLLHLRYLQLMDTPIRELSKKIGHLKFLQTLVLHGTGVVELPTSLKQLRKLMYLYVNEKTRLPDWICELTSLVFLCMDGADVDRGLIKELDKLRDLRKLRTQLTLQDEGEVRGFLDALSNLEKIESIMLLTSKPFFDHGAIMQPNFVLRCKNLRQLLMNTLVFFRLPKWINSQALPNLCVLGLALAVVDQREVEILDKFEKLCSLCLNVSFLSKLIIGGGSFKNLRYFRIDGLCQLEFLKGAMPRVEDIWYTAFTSTYGFSLKLGLENLSAIQTVNILLSCMYCLPREVEEVEAELKHAVRIHPNRPTLQITRDHDDQMFSSSDSVMERQKKKALRLWRRLCCRDHALTVMRGKISEMGNIKTELNPSDAKNKAQRFFGEFSSICHLVINNELHQVRYDTFARLTEHGLRLMEDELRQVQQGLGLVPDDTLVVRLMREVFPEQADTHIHDGDFDIMAEEIAALERAHEIYTVEHPRLAAMFDALTYAFRLQGAVPRPQVIALYIDVDDVMDSNFGARFGLRNNQPLEGQLVKAHIDCALCFPTEVEAVEAELRNAFHIEQHSNPPTIEIIRFREDKMLNSDPQMLERQMWKVRGFCQEFTAIVDHVLHKLHPVQDCTPIHDHDLNRVLEDNNSSEEALEILTIEYPRFAAMTDEQRYASSLQGAMPMPQVLNLNICVFDIMVHKLGLNFGLLGKISSLRVIKAHVMCHFCFKMEVEEVESELRRAVRTHRPNNPPTLEIIRYAEDRIVNSDSDSQMLLERQICRRTGLADRVNHQKHIHNTLIRKVAKIVEQKTNTTLSDAAKHKKQRFHKHFNAIKDRVEHELLRVNENIPNRDLKRVTEETEDMERALQILTVEYPRLAAMLEELKIAFSFEAYDQADYMINDEDVSEASLYDTEVEGEMPVEEVSAASLSDREDENEKSDDRAEEDETTKEEEISPACPSDKKEADEVTEDLVPALRSLGV